MNFGSFSYPDAGSLPMVRVGAGGHSLQPVINVEGRIVCESMTGH